MGLGALASTVLFSPLTPDHDRQLLAMDLPGAGYLYKVTLPRAGIGVLGSRLTD